MPLWRRLPPSRAVEGVRPFSTEKAIRMSPDDMALVVIEGDALGRRIPVGDAPVVIGRSVGVDLQISDPTVSRHHCVIWRASGRCWVRDLGSTNRTRVNDRSASMSELFEGDVLAVGQTVLTVSVDRNTDRPATASDDARSDG